MKKHVVLKTDVSNVSIELGTQKTVDVFLLRGKTFNSFKQALKDDAFNTNDRVKKLLARPKRWR
ncbi:hypothetical protein ACIPW4_26125 [Pseudomonas sp. NPDC089996]|uniref:hypothetical protein n=1 Tax=Pseudomonas sp. NPDC089996 TaxID=3364474 RepID=UPI0037FAEDEA